MKKQIGKKLALKKSTVANLDRRMLVGIKGGTGDFTVGDTCPCVDTLTDSDPPTIIPCPTLDTSKDTTGDTTVDPGNTL